MNSPSIVSRLIVAAWGIPLLVGLIWLGGWWTASLIGAITVVANWEYYRLQTSLGRKPLIEVGLAAGIAVVILWQIGGMEAIGWTFASFFLTMALATILTGRSHTDLLATLGGVIYAPLLGGSILLIRRFESTGTSGLELTLCLIGAIWTCDTAAYTFGRLTGKRPLAPSISPSKTVEGFIWGFGWAGIFAGFAFWFGFLEWDLAVAVGFSAGLIGQLGDLVESALKREAGVKDTGTFLPGHGGALDRFDSMIAAAPVLAMYLTVRDQIFSLIR